MDDISKGVANTLQPVKKKMHKNHCRFFVQAEDWTAGGRCQGSRIRGQQEEHSAGDYKIPS